MKPYFQFPFDGKTERSLTYRMFSQTFASVMRSDNVNYGGAMFGHVQIVGIMKPKEMWAMGYTEDDIYDWNERISQLPDWGIENFEIRDDNTGEYHMIPLENLYFIGYDLILHEESDFEAVDDPHVRALISAVYAAGKTESRVLVFWPKARSPFLSLADEAQLVVSEIVDIAYLAMQHLADIIAFVNEEGAAFAEHALERKGFLPLKSDPQVYVMEPLEE